MPERGTMRNRITKEKNCTYAVMAAGVLLRLIYIIFSTIYDRQYDIGMIDLDAGHTVTGGHLAYIQYIYHNGLPDFDPTTVYQFHHPPLHHFICATWMKLCSLFIKNTDVLEESIQIIPFICSLLTLWVVYKTVCRMELGDKAKCIVMTVFAFHPSLVMFSGSVNNDCMAFLFTVLIVYFTVDWSRSGSWYSIMALALCIGLGMLVKQNVAEMAFPVAAVFVYVFVKNVACREKRMRLLGQFTAFGLVSVPIGMSFYIRNLVKFNMSMFWVYELPKDSWQYVGNIPVVNRFLWPVPAELLDNLRQFKLGCGYNVWMQIIRTSVLGEWDMANVGRMIKVLAVFLMLIGALLAFMAFCAFVMVFVRGGIRKQIGTPDCLVFTVGYAVNMLCYFLFVYNYPQECSMNFRYIVITILFPAVALGMWWQESKNKWKRGIVLLTLALFAVCSTLMIGCWLFC